MAFPMTISNLGEPVSSGLVTLVNGQASIPGLGAHTSQAMVVLTYVSPINANAGILSYSFDSEIGALTVDSNSGNDDNDVRWGMMG